MLGRNMKAYEVVVCIMYALAWLLLIVVLEERGEKAIQN
jgi:hypothetical protein